MATTQKTTVSLRRDYGSGWFGGGADGRTSDVMALGPPKELEPKPAKVLENAKAGLKEAERIAFADDPVLHRGVEISVWGDPDIGVRRDFVTAVIERAGDGGDWFKVTSVTTASAEHHRKAALAYCLNGEIVGLVAPYVLTEDGAE